MPIYLENEQVRISSNEYLNDKYALIKDSWNYIPQLDMQKYHFLVTMNYYVIIHETGNNTKQLFLLFIVYSELKWQLYVMKK